MQLQQVEDEYIMNLLKETFGNRVLAGSFARESSGLGFGTLQFTETSFKSKTGGAFGLVLTSANMILPENQARYAPFIGHIVLSIHGMIQEEQTKGFLGFGKKIVKRLVLRVVVNPKVFKFDGGFEQDRKKYINWYISDAAKPMGEKSGLQVVILPLEYEQ